MANTTKARLAGVCALTLFAAPAFASGIQGGNLGMPNNTGMVRGFNSNSDAGAYGNAGNPMKTAAPSAQAATPAATTAEAQPQAAPQSAAPAGR